MTEDGWSYSMDQLITNRAIVMKPERVRELMEIKKDGPVGYFEASTSSIPLT